MEEIEENLQQNRYHTVLPVDIYTEKQTVMDMLASFENENYIRRIYSTKKCKVTGELKLDTATKLKDCIQQGRSLLLSAQTANMLSKPLIDFYAASAYAYASIVVNSPLHKSLDSLKGSHGHSYDHEHELVKFGGDAPAGTFKELLFSCYLPQIVYNDVTLKFSTVPSLEYVQTHTISISLIALLSTVPELIDQVQQVNTAQKRLHPIDIKTEVDRGEVAYKFIIGDGHDLPDEKAVKCTFGVTDIKRAEGKYVINVPVAKTRNIMPTIYRDIRGNLWYVDPLIPELYLPEICLHFLIISALCNIMRYSPHEWNNILSNKVSSEFSLLVSKYLRLFEIKYPMLLIEQLGNFQPVIKT